jgi:hypothetical protein
VNQPSANSDQFRRYAKVFPIAIPRYLLLFARARYLSGDIAGALRCTRWSLRVAVRVAMPYEEALAKWQLSQWLDPYDPSRRILLEEENTLFAKWNAIYEVKQTQAALEPSV